MRAGTFLTDLRAGLARTSAQTSSRTSAPDLIVGLRTSLVPDLYPIDAPGSSAGLPRGERSGVTRVRSVRGPGWTMYAKHTTCSRGAVRAAAVCAAVAGTLAVTAGCTVQENGRTGPPVRFDGPTAPSEVYRGTHFPGSPDAGRTPDDDRAPSSRPPTTSAAPRTSGPPATPRPSTPPPVILMSPGDSGAKVRELQARLRQLAWLFEGPTGKYGSATEKAVEGFQGKRGLPRTGRTDTVTWQRLLGMTHEPGQWELYAMGGQPAAPPDPRCMTGRVLCISKTSRTLRWMIDGRTVSQMEVRFGAAETPTREGVFQVYWKSRYHVSTLYHSPMPYAMFFSGGEAVHYSPDFAARGYAGNSHGCVNVRDESKIAALYAQVRNGDKVVVYW